MILRLDSDDMYRNTVIDGLMKMKIRGDQEAVLYQNGYLYDSVKKRIMKCHHVSPPFYALIYEAKEYLKGKRHVLKKGHINVINLNNEIISENNFIWHVHELNTMNEFHRLAKGYGIGKVIVNRVTMNNILNDFGLKL